MMARGAGGEEGEGRERKRRERARRARGISWRGRRGSVREEDMVGGAGAPLRTELVELCTSRATSSRWPFYAAPACLDETASCEVGDEPT